MSVDLLKIPGIEPKRNRTLQRVLKPPRKSMLRPREPVDWVPYALGALFVGLALYIFNAFWSSTRVDVETENLDDGMEVTTAELTSRAIRISIDPGDRTERVSVELDGEPLTSEHYEIDGDAIVWQPGELLEGPHELSLSVPRPVLDVSTFRWGFEVDDTPPEIEVPRLFPPVGICQPVTVDGQVNEGASLTLGGTPVDLDDGAFSLHYDQVPPAPLSLVATDGAGNQTRAEVVLPVQYPGGQGVHVTAAAWGYEPLRTGILELIDAGLVSVVQLDLKDEGGIVGYDSKVPLAHEVGAVRPEFRIHETVADLKSRGVRVVGRVVAFRDAPLADWAWANDRRDWVVQDAEGGKLALYGGFTNMASPEVRQYNLNIALEGVEAGVDDIMWDYVRRPEGDPAGMVFPGLQGTPSDGIVQFLAEGHTALREACAYQGAAVFGISADRPFAVAQDVPRMARHLDYLSPMLYPSHWVPGEYGVENPPTQPAQIVSAALADFQAKVGGTGTVLMPWLQDFTHGPTYGPDRVRAQIDASIGLGVTDWLLWNAGVEYTPEALDPGLLRVRSG